MRVRFVFAVLGAALVTSAAGCESTSAQSACGPATCSGCCSLDGQCLSGETEESCGGGGAACSVCIASQTCVEQGCVLVVGDAGAGADAGEQPDAGTTADAGPPGTAITAPAETWTWVDFPDAVCGNGSATGLGVNPTSASNDVLIYMEGGGACWDEFTCFTYPTASNLSTGYDGADFAVASWKTAFAVDRAQAGNPFKDMSYVYIPYCTGDVHGGDAVRTYGAHPEVHHNGAKNVEAFLKRLVPTFPNALRIFLTGSSAGGFGAQLNYERVAAAFPNAEVHVLADSGQMVTPYGGLLPAWLAAWNLRVPAACVNCTSDFSLFPEYLATTYPNRRFALNAWDRDSILVAFFGLTQTEFQTATMALLANHYDPHPNARYFLLAGTSHTMLGSLGTLTAPNGTTLNSFVTRWVNDDPAWASVRP